MCIRDRSAYATYGLFDDKGLVPLFEGRRKSMGLASDGSGRKLENAELSGVILLPEAERDLRNAKSPLTPENIVEKAKIAYPELKTSVEVEAMLRKEIPQWDFLRPKSKLLKEFKKMDDKRSATSKKILEFIDKAELHSVGEGKTKEMQVLEMDRFMYQLLRSLSATYLKATQNKELSEDIAKFAHYFGQQTEIVPKD